MRWILAALLLLIAGAGLWLHAQNPEREVLDTRHRAEAAMSFIALSEGITAYRLEGPDEGPLVVLVHGFSTPSYLWADTARALHAAGFRTLRYDLYGRGWSDRPHGDYDLGRFTRQLAELLSALAGETPVHLVGLSMGGLVVSALAVETPARVDRLVLIAPFNTPVRVPMLERPVIGEIAAAAVYFPRQVRLQQANFADPAQFERYVPGFVEQLRFKGFRRAILSTLRHLIVVDPLPVYTALGAQSRPVTVIWGEADAVLPHTQAPRVLAALGAETRLISIADAGHLPQADQPQAVHRALLEALGR